MSVLCPQSRERELLAACGKNPYERALLLMQMATFQTQSRAQVQLLNEAMECLERAGTVEAGLFTMAQV